MRFALIAIRLTGILRFVTNNRIIALNGTLYRRDSRKEVSGHEETV